MLPWNLRQLISYFFALIIYSINLLKTERKTFATGNAIYPLPRTIIQITNDNSIFRKEGIMCSESNIDIRTFVLLLFIQDEFEDAKEVIRMRKSKDRQHNTNNSSYCYVLLNTLQFLKTYLPCNDISQSDHFVIRYHSSVVVLSLLSIQLIDIWVHKNSLNPTLFFLLKPEM